MHAASAVRWRLVLGCLTLFAIAAGDTAPVARPALYASYTLPAVPALSAVTAPTALPLVDSSPGPAAAPAAPAPTLASAAPVATPSAAVATAPASAATFLTTTAPPATPVPLPTDVPAPTAVPAPTNAPAPTAPPPPPPPTAAPATACGAGWFCYPRVGVSGPIVPYTDCAGGTDVGTAIRAFTCLSPRYLMGHAYTQFGRITQWRAGDVVYAYGQVFTVTGALTARSCEPPPLPLAPLSLQTSLSPDACGAVLIVQAR